MDNETTMNEVLQRSRRIETKLTRMAEKLDVDINRDETTVRYDPDHDVLVLENVDVSVSALLRVARAAGLHQRRVPVYRDAELVMYLYVGQV